MTTVAKKKRKSAGRPRSHPRAKLIEACVGLLLELADRRTKLTLPAQLKVSELRNELGYHERAIGCVSDCPICYGDLVIRRSKDQ